jgi:hypothetical protein
MSSEVEINIMETVYTCKLYSREGTTIRFGCPFVKLLGNGRFRTVLPESGDGSFKTIRPFSRENSLSLDSFSRMAPKCSMLK